MAQRIVQVCKPPWTCHLLSSCICGHHPHHPPSPYHQSIVVIPGKMCFIGSDIVSKRCFCCSTHLRCPSRLPRYSQCFLPCPEALRLSRSPSVIAWDKMLWSETFLTDRVCRFNACVPPLWSSWSLKTRQWHMSSDMNKPTKLSRHGIASTILRDRAA